MPYVQANGIRLYYELAGEGTPLVFISGTGGDLRAQPNIFKAPLAGVFTLLAYDQRGLGRSEKPDRPYTMADYADDAAALMDAVGWNRAHVVGVSFGGMVAQHMALRHPERIDRLVLVCTSSGGSGGASYPLHELQQMTAEERARFLIPINDTRCDSEWQRNNPQAVQQAVEFRLAATRLGGDDPRSEMGARRQLEARQDHDIYDRLQDIRMPTLLCGGRFDGIATPGNMRAMADRIPNAQLELFEGGHLFLIQDKQAYPAIIRFLQQD